MSKSSKTTRSHRSHSHKDLKQRKGLSFNEWVRRKEAEKRMKQRLMKEVKDEIRQELIEIAQEEQLA